MSKPEYDINTQVPKFSKRAEILAAWYLRFNGFFVLQNFILHDAGLYKPVGGQLTEADILAIRLPYTIETIKSSGFEITICPHRVLNMNRQALDFVIAEVSSKQCKFNWLDNQNKIVNHDYLSYALKRIGWWNVRDEIDCLCNKLSQYKQLSEIDDVHNYLTRIRLVSFGNTVNGDLDGFLQITFRDILIFMKEELFASYGRDKRLKRIVSDHSQWNPLICQIYNRLLGHRIKEHSVDEVIIWLFPNTIGI